MSVKIMGMVWDCALPRPEKFVLLAYADHADHDGNNVYPSYERIAYKTGYDRRQVIRIVDHLREMGIMVNRGVSNLGTNLWRIDVTRLPKHGEQRLEEPEEAPESSDILSPTGDILTPAQTEAVTFCHPTGDILTPGGDISSEKTPKMSPESSFNRPLKPSIKRDGDTETEIVDQVVPGGKISPREAWKNVLEQLQVDMPRGPYETWVKSTRPVDFDLDHSTIYIRAPSAYAQEWLTSRLASTVTRLMTGICGRAMTVQFVPPPQAIEYATNGGVC